MQPANFLSGEELTCSSVDFTQRRTMSNRPLHTLPLSSHCVELGQSPEEMEME